MKYIIIGTAGHVDHGKSAIIKALTGTDTDRLKEEKLRGISIDLGFAALQLGDTLAAGIVDVPGHERFLKNMLAGTGGIDIAMLVVAADEGIMPQTKEHLAMLQLYGIKHGLVVINKMDKVDQEWLELIESEVREQVKDTFLENAPCCLVSAVTGAGMAGLKEALAALAANVPARDSKAPFRLWIDRVFTIKGHGVVVTGSILSGRIRVGDGLLLYPSGQVVRVRGLEWHGQKVDEMVAGQRAAINLAGIETGEAARGMVLSAPERGEVSTIWDIAADWQEEVTSGLRVRLHLGTGEFLGRIYSFKNADSSCMRLILEQPLAAGAGDRGIIRQYSPQTLLGGAALLAPGTSSRRLSAAREALAQAYRKSEVQAAVYYRLAENRRLATSEEIRRQNGYLPDAVIDKAIKQLVSSGKLCCLEKSYIAALVLSDLKQAAVDAVAAFHKAQPDRSGLSKEILRQKLELADKDFETILAAWLADGTLINSGGIIALKTHADKHGGWQQELMAKAAAALADVGLISVDPALLGEKMTLPPDKIKAAHDTLIRAGLLIRIGDMFVYSKTMQYIVQVIHKHFQENDTLTVAELRDKLNTSRKIALPIIEYLDMNKYTTRQGDLRYPGPKILNLSE